MLPPFTSHMPPRLPAPPRSPPSLPAFRPLVFDLTLEVDNSSLAGNGDSGWRVLHVYGSPNPNDTALSGGGTIMKVGRGGVGGRGWGKGCGVWNMQPCVNTCARWPASPSMYLLSPLLPTYAPCVQIHTLFPSPKTEEGIKGGVVLLRMRPPAAGANSTPLQLSVTYTDREGKQFRCGQSGQTFEEEVGQCAAADMPAYLLHSRSAPLCSFSFPSLPACLPPSLPLLQHQAHGGGAPAGCCQ
jgi:hypothetical protein